LCLNAIPTPLSEICTRILKLMQLLKEKALDPCTTHSNKITQQFKKEAEKYYNKQTKCNVL